MSFNRNPNWSGGLAEWVEGDTAFLSIAFSWRLREAYQRAIWYRSQGYRVRAGGPGMALPSLRKYIAPVAEIGGEIDALVHHNRMATIASRGCPVGCYFCIVPKIEGTAFTLLPNFIPRPILCDNNLSALPVEYQEFIIDKYRKADVPLLDANSGFEPRTFDEGTYRRWKTLNRGPWRFAYDETSEEQFVFPMTRILRDKPGWQKRVYVLIGNEPFEPCLRRIRQVIEWGCEPYAQPLIPLNALDRKPKIAWDWTRERLEAVARWANKWIWRTVPKFEDYHRGLISIPRDNPGQISLLGADPK